MNSTTKLKGKGKKRSLDIPTPTIVGENEPPHPTKRSKRAETRQCPICDEHIPLRLLAKHAELESERVDEIMNSVGTGNADDHYLDTWAVGEPGPSTRRISALKARKSFSSSASTTKYTTRSTGVVAVAQTIQLVRRHRKKRHARLKEMLRADAEGEGEANNTSSWAGRFTGEEIDCPVCGIKVRGDEDVVNAHVDACLAYEGRQLEEERERQREAEALLHWEDESPEDDGTYVGNLRGAGFQTRNMQEADVDHEIDVEGDDQAIFGEVQFTEGDVLPVSENQRQQYDEEADVNIEDDVEDEAPLEQQNLRDLVAVGRRKDVRGGSARPSGPAKDALVLGEMDELDIAIAVARQRADKAAMAAALENKLSHLQAREISTIPTSAPQLLLCRICLDPYSEPTVSTGCWHTCCKECWLRCLGSTKLCPICKRITCATELRRIYL